MRMSLEMNRLRSRRIRAKAKIRMIVLGSKLFLGTCNCFPRAKTQLWGHIWTAGSWGRADAHCGKD